ncbi:22165_t:CDS:1, partial [Dentiscutata erythropus]
FLCESAQNPITKEKWRQCKKNKSKNWKDFLNLLYNTYWSYQ